MLPTGGLMPGLLCSGMELEGCARTWGKEVTNHVLEEDIPGLLCILQMVFQNSCKTPSVRIPQTYTGQEWVGFDPILGAVVMLFTLLLPPPLVAERADTS